MDQQLLDGESLTLKRKGYTLYYVRPCTMEKGKKMAKIHLSRPPKDLFSRLEKAGFDEFKAFPKLGMAKIKLGRKQILVFKNGDISIRAAEDRKDVLETVEKIMNALKS